MDLEILKKRIADLAKAIEESAARHNMLCGHKAEAEFMLSEMTKEPEVPMEGEIV